MIHVNETLIKLLFSILPVKHGQHEMIECVCVKKLSKYFLTRMYLTVMGVFQSDMGWCI